MWVVKIINKIKKRDGRIVSFDKSKIKDAIQKAIESIKGEDNTNILTEKTVQHIEKNIKGIPDVEKIQDCVEETLIQHADAKTAKAYILYRQERASLRKARSQAMGAPVYSKLSVNSIRVLKERYLQRDENGEIIETPDEMFWRVAKNIAQIDKKYDKKTDAKKTENKFYSIMANLDFLPNSPTLMNAGLKIQQLSGCFVLPIEDSLESIFQTLKIAAKIHQSGGGTGFSFSKIRPRGDLVKSTHGIASGPISFLQIYNATTEVIKQGGRRRGANMAVLRIDHPDILEFISCKEKENAIANFNISVGITDKFMKAVELDKEYELVNPKNNKVAGKLMAREVFNLIVLSAWKNGEPGIIFLDTINKHNPTPALGEIETTNPCAEEPLLPYESCNLGSINVSNFVKENNVDWERLAEVIHAAVHFLDNVIDANKYPLDEIKEATLKTRKIGLGIMGFADMLAQLGIPYNSEKCVEFSDKFMKFFSQEAKKASHELSLSRGPFPAFRQSIFATGKKQNTLRNAYVTTIAPTGSISMIAECSSGIEPLFSICYTKKVLQGQEFLYINQHFEKAVKEKSFYSDELMQKITNRDSIQDIKEIPEEIRKAFVASHDISPEWHVKIQATFQKYIDSSISKTINFPSKATIKEVESAYWLAYELGCKGITIYRDRSREYQVLNIQVSKKCPSCKTNLKAREGCLTCEECGYSQCILQ